MIESDLERAQADTSNENDLIKTILKEASSGVEDEAKEQTSLQQPMSPIGKLEAELLRPPTQHTESKEGCKLDKSLTSNRQNKDANSGSSIHDSIADSIIERLQDETLAQLDMELTSN